MSRRKQWQRRIFLLCWAAYALAYFCRMNLAVALPAIGREIGANRATLGIIGSSFFWSYAIGQLVNGYLGDRFSSRWFIGLGLLASALINLSFGFARSISLMALLWGMNGFFQSMLWGPIMKTLSVWLPDKPATRTAVQITTSTIAGYYLAWGLSGYLVSRFSWAWAFWVPAGVVLAFGFCWLLLVRDTPASASVEMPAMIEHEQHRVQAVSAPRGSLAQVAAQTGLWLLALVCLAQGIIKEGINLWGPTMLAEISGPATASTVLSSLLIPTMNLAGIFLSGAVAQVFRGQERSAVASLLLACSLGAAALAFAPSSLLLSALLLGAVSCFVYGANTLLLTVIPLQYRRYGLTSTVAGGLDAAAYLGAAASGVLNGWLADGGGWGRAVLSWSAVGLAAALLLWCHQRQAEAGTYPD
jgi:sugar phosphate permease